MINLIKSINEYLCNNTFIVVVVVLILGFIPLLVKVVVEEQKEINSTPVKCQNTTVTLEGGVKATLKSCEGKVTLMENSK